MRQLTTIRSMLFIAAAVWLAVSALLIVMYYREHASAGDGLTADALKKDTDLLSLSSGAEVVFTLTNSGKYPVSIVDTSTTCGCTHAELNMTRIPPGESAILTVTIRASGKRERFIEQVFVYWRATAGEPLELPGAQSKLLLLTVVGAVEGVASAST